MRTLALALALLMAMTAAAHALTAEDLHLRYLQSSVEYRQANEALEAAWKRLRSVCTPEQFKAELAAQREWLKKRNARMLDRKHAGDAAEARDLAALVGARVRGIDARTGELRGGKAGGPSGQAKGPAMSKRDLERAEELHQNFLAGYLRYKKADMALSIAWRRLRSVCPEGAYKAELEGQRAWLQSRNAALLDRSRPSERAKALAAAGMIETRAKELEEKTWRMLADRPRADCWTDFRSRTEALKAGADREELRRRAEGGDADAQFDLALLDMGAWLSEGAEAEARGREWLRRAAESGHPGAKYLMGQSLTTSSSRVDEEDVGNFAPGLKFLEEAAEAGIVCAPLRLAEAYRTGGAKSLRDDPLADPDPEKALVWYRRALAIQEDGEILLELADLEPDPEKSMTYARRAVDLYGSTDAMYDLHRRYEKGEKVNRDPEKAAEWLELFYLFRSGGDPSDSHDPWFASIPHAVHYEPFDIAEYWEKEAHDRKRAALCYEYIYDLFDSGIHDSEYFQTFYLAGIFFTGERAYKDYERALHLYELTIRGIEEARRHPSDPALTIELPTNRYTEYSNNPSALYVESKMKAGWILCAGGNQGLLNYRKAIEYFEDIRDLEPNAALNLGILHENGLGVPRNPYKAGAYYQDACGRGIEQACQRLR